jgi:hypothetical protein
MWRIRKFTCFAANSSHFDDGTKGTSAFLRFQCCNCNKYPTIKVYSLLVSLDKNVFEAMKLGEFPDFGTEPMPAKVLKLIGPEREYYFKGKKSENHGLGIDAFAYYRRVVENQKDRVLEEILKVCAQIDAPADMIADLQAAKKEIRFGAAVARIKHGLPQALLIKTHNPLTILHSALVTASMIDKDDATCLTRAKKHPHNIDRIGGQT